MKIVIIGAGFTGTQLARKLIDEKNDVVLIDNNEETVRHAANHLDCTVVHADGNNLATLEDAGIASADALVTLTDDDEYNMIACSLVDSMYPKVLKIARVREYVYYVNTHKTAQNLADRFAGERRPVYGIDFMVQPDVEASELIISAARYGAVTDIIAFDNDFVITSLSIEAGSVFDGVPLKNLRSIIDCPFVIAYLETEDGTILPGGETVLVPGIRISILSSEEDVPKLLEKVNARVDPLRKIAILGANHIGLLLAEQMLNSPRSSFFKRIFGKSKNALARNLVIVDEDAERCREASERIPDAKVLCGDMTDEALISEEGLDECDLVVSVTSNYERNVVVAAYMKSVGALRTIALAANAGFANVARKLGVDIAVPMRDAVVDSIVGHLRGDNVQAIHTVGEGSFEIVECDVAEGSRFAGKLLRNIASDGEFIVLLVRKPGSKNYEIANGSTCLEASSHIVYIAQAGNEKILRRFGK